MCKNLKRHYFKTEEVYISTISFNLISYIYDNCEVDRVYICKINDLFTLYLYDSFDVNSSFLMKGLLVIRRVNPIQNLFYLKIKFGFFRTICYLVKFINH